MPNKMNDTLDVKRPVPAAYSFSRPYWEGTRSKKILVQYCPRSGQYQFYPRPVSIATGRRDLEWREVSGNGEVFSFTVARRARDPFRGHEPYLIATVTLDVGVNLLGNIVDCGLDEIRIGMKVVPHWAPLPNGMHMLMFRPRGAA